MFLIFLMVRMPWVHRQTMLTGCRFKVTDVGIEAPTPVITTAWFGSSWAASLPAVVQEADGVAAELRRRAPDLGSASPCLAAGLSAPRCRP